MISGSICISGCGSGSGSGSGCSRSGNERDTIFTSLAVHKVVNFPSSSFSDPFRKIYKAMAVAPHSGQKVNNLR